MQALKDSNETYKMQMYRALAWTLGTFVSLFVTLSVALLTAQGSQQSWQWKWEWTQVVAWEVSKKLHGAALSRSFISSTSIGSLDHLTESCRYL